MVRKLLSFVLGLVIFLPGLAGVTASSAAALDSPAGRLPAWQPKLGTPHVLDGRVLSVAEVGNTILLGGTFTSARNEGSSQQLSRTNLLAFNRTTGQISTTFVPQPNGTVEVILPAGDGQTVYVGGSFTTIGGLARKNLVRLNVSDGSVVSTFKPGNITGKVNDLALSDGRLWLGGGFTSINGTAQTALATVNPTTGAFDPYMKLSIAGIHNGGSTTVAKFDITPDGKDLVAIGNFRTLEGVQNQQALRLDLSGAAAKPENWQTAFFETLCGAAWYSYVHDVDISPDGTYFVIVTTGGYGGVSTACDSSSRFEIATQGSGIQPSWLDKTGGDTNWSVEITDSVVYVGGHPRWQNNPLKSNEPGPGAVSRPGIAALDPANGLPYSWNPTRTRGVGVFDMLATTEGLYVASDTDRIGSYQYRGRIALMPWTGGSEFPSVHTPGLPNDLYEVTSGNALREHAVTASTFGPGTPASSQGPDWSAVKGAFMLNGEVYLGMSDGTFVKRSFDGQSWGDPVPVNTSDLLTPLTTWSDDIKAMTGMFYDSGRIYFTKAKSNQLFFRFFTPESKVVGANRYIASSAVTGIAFDQVRGTFLAGDRLYWTTTQSQLRSIAWNRGPISGAPVAGTQNVVSGAGVDQNDWSGARSLFLFQDANGADGGGTPVTTPPTASFTGACTDLTCSFDASASTPGSDPIAGYSWDFGDQTTAADQPGPTTEHSYAAAGGYQVQLTVTDTAGRTGTTTVTVNPTEPPGPQPPTASFTSSCSALSCSFDGASSSDPEGGALTYAWSFGDTAEGSGVNPTHDYAAGGDYTVTLTVTDPQGLTGTATKTVSPTEAKVLHVASAATNGNRAAHKVTVPAAVQPGDQLLLFMTLNNSTSDITAPAGWSLVPGGAVDATGMRQRVWTRTATVGDAGSTVTVTTSSTVDGSAAYVKSDLTVSAYRATPGATLSVTGSAGAVRAGGATSYATPEVDLPATGSSWVVSYWASKSTEGRTWTAPAGQATRTTTAGAGGGAISALLADSGQQVNGARGGGLVATLDSAASTAETFTVVVTSQTA